MFNKIKALWIKFKRRNIGTFIIGVEGILTIELEYKTAAHLCTHFRITNINLNQHWSIGNAINEIRVVRKRKANLLDRSDSYFNENYCERNTRWHITLNRFPTLSPDKIDIHESFGVDELITAKEKAFLTAFVKLYCESVAYGLSAAESKLKNASHMEEAFTYASDKLTYGIKDVIELSIVPDRIGFVKVVNVNGLCRQDLPRIFTNVSDDWWFDVVDSSGCNYATINIKESTTKSSSNYTPSSKDEYKYLNKIYANDVIHIADFLIVLDHLKQAYKRYQQLTTPPEI